MPTRIRPYDAATDRAELLAISRQQMIKLTGGTKVLEGRSEDRFLVGDPEHPLHTHAGSLVAEVDGRIVQAIVPHVTMKLHGFVDQSHGGLVAKWRVFRELWAATERRLRGMGLDEVHVSIVPEFANLQGFLEKAGFTHDDRIHLFYDLRPPD